MIQSAIYSELVVSDFESWLYMAPRLLQDYKVNELTEDLIKITELDNKLKQHIKKWLKQIIE
jgi:hypothetical protein